MSLSVVDALASIAYLALAARGNHIDPTYHEVVAAVTRAAPLLDLTDDPAGVNVMARAIDIICERHNWTTAKVVQLYPRPRVPK